MTKAPRTLLSVTVAASLIASLMFVHAPASARQRRDAARRRPPEQAAGLVRAERPIPNSYIVVLKDEVDGQAVGALAARLAAEHGGQVAATYRRALKGFSVRMRESAAEALARHPAVAYVEEDSVVETAATQQNAPWHLDRIDQRDLPLSGTFTYYNSGAGVNAYVIDTGIRTTHEEFEGRASVAFDNVNDGQNGEDCHGHGTHVASLIGGKTFGVAKSVQLYSVRAFSCSNQTSLTRAVGAIDFVAAEHVKPAVALLSVVATGISPSLDAAVYNALDSGVVMVLAAGNTNADASTRSPARVEEALTVSATDMSDVRASFSNYGWVLDVFAPGVDIEGANWFDDTSTVLRSGTSMAAAQVAGTAARFLSGNPFIGPYEIYDGVISNSTPGRVTGEGLDSPNLLLYRPNGFIGFETARDISAGEIYVMNADGSGQTRLTYGLARDQTPSVSPDGTKIVFASDRDLNPSPSVMWNSAAFEIYVMNIDGTNVQRLTNNSSSDVDPTWSPDGTQIAFATNRDGDFEIFKMNANGTGQTRVTNNTYWDSAPDWSPDGTMIAFHSDRGIQMNDVFVINVDGTGEVQLTDAWSMYEQCEEDCLPSTDGSYPTWSPDGELIAFEGSGQLWVMHADGSDPAPIFDLAGSYAAEPAWSPDGTQIAFAKSGEVVVVNANGIGLATLTNAQGADGSPDWSPDGAKVAFVSLRDDLGNEIYLINHGGGGGYRPVGRWGSDYDTAWSPDGRKIAFLSNRDGNYEIYVMNSDGTGQTRLTNTTSEEREPVWSPDGTKIAFVRYTGVYDVYVMNADGTGVVNLTQNPQLLTSTGNNNSPSWSPDGSKIAFGTTRHGNNEIYTMNPDGTGLVRITNNTFWDYDPAWSPDGSKIVFSSHRSGNQDIYVMNADGTGEVRLTTAASDDISPRWSPDGERIVFSSLRHGNHEIYIMNPDGTGQTRLTYNLVYDTRPAWQPL